MGNHCICSSNMEIPNDLKAETKQYDAKTSVSHGKDTKLVHFVASKWTKYLKKIELRPREKRLVFVSFIGLFQSWRSVPLHKMMKALLLLPLSKKWIYEPIKYREQLRSSFVTDLSIFSDLVETQQFVKLLKFKDKQGLVVWMMDHCDEYLDACDEHNSLITTFWFNLSSILSAIKDPATGSKYKPLELNHLWYSQSGKYLTKYDVSASSILKELFFFGMNFRSMQEIIYQSNPDSLLPVVSYYEYECRDLQQTMKRTTDEGIRNMYDTKWSSNDSTAFISDTKANAHAIWHIADDYDPDR